MQSSIHAGCRGHLHLSRFCLTPLSFSGGACLLSPGSDFLLLTFMQIQPFMIFLLGLMLVSAFICRWVFLVLANYQFFTDLNFYVHVFQERSRRPLCKKSWTLLQRFLSLS